MESVTVGGPESSEPAWMGSCSFWVLPCVAYAGVSCWCESLPCAESSPSAFIWLSQPLFSRVALAAGLLPAVDGKQHLCTGRRECRTVCVMTMMGPLGLVLQMGFELLVLEMSCWM